MVGVDDAQEQADLLTSLIDSLPSASDPNTVRPQIKEEALTLQSMLSALVRPAVGSAQSAAEANFDELILWAACPDANLRFKVVNAAKSIQPISDLLSRVTGWTHCLGTLGWSQTPEVPSAALPNYLATYRSITGT
jgi:hypothetical protein